MPVRPARADGVTRLSIEVLTYVQPFTACGAPPAARGWGMRLRVQPTT